MSFRAAHCEVGCRDFFPGLRPATSRDGSWNPFARRCDGEAITDVAEVSERGDIYFLYRPRVEEEQPQDVEEIQRLFVVLQPEGHRSSRSLVVGRKRLPEPEAGDRFWAFVDRVTHSPEETREEFGRVTYSTATRGERTQAEARPAGEGVYAIIRHGDHTHLAYALELPESPGEVQQDLNLTSRASYVVAVKNPQASSPPGAGLSPRRTADYPTDLAERFSGRRFAPLDPPDFLDHEGAELVLIAAGGDAAEELGVSLDPEEESVQEADVFSTLGLRPGEQPDQPLLRGEWR
jgi:hypothetical protein